MSTEPVQSNIRPKLIWLLFMHRHGDRCPLNMAPRDKYNDIKYWPEGFGNLNNAGRIRMYKLGKYIRSRYNSFITDNFRKVYSRSSDVERCIESSMSLLAGLYPPVGKAVWNETLPWVPVPVHSVPPLEDYLLNEAGRAYFPEFVKEIIELQKSDTVKKLYENSIEERALLEREMGYDFDNFVKFKCVYSTLDIEERNGFEMPGWYTPELKKQLYDFSGIAFGLAGGGTDTLRRLRMGCLLKDIVARMELADLDERDTIKKSEYHMVDNTLDYRKIVHYSTHDSLIAAMLEALNINTPKPIPPAFGATFFFELYVDVEDCDGQVEQVGEKYLKIYYLDDTESEQPIEKILPNCPLDANNRLTLKNFINYVKNLFPSEMP